MKNITLILSICLFCCQQLFSQNNNSIKPCSSPEASQFDFWKGEWDLSWNGDIVRGANHITEEMGGCVVYEHFSNPSGNYYGWSWSVFDPRSGKWKQTWVDNQGAYIDLTGGMQDGKMILQTEFHDKAGKLVMQRMVFYNITQDQFDWEWQGSKDAGQSWNTNWKIHYKRKRA